METILTNIRDFFQTNPIAVVCISGFGGLVLGWILCRLVSGRKFKLRKLELQEALDEQAVSTLVQDGLLLGACVETA